MRRFILIAAMLATAAHSAELNIPDATRRPATMGTKAAAPALPPAPTAPAPSAAPAARKPAAPASTPEAPTAPVEAPQAAVNPAQDTLANLQRDFKSWVVSAILGNTAILRNGQQTLVIQHGVMQDYFDGTVLVASVQDGTVRIAAGQGTKRRLVFVGSVGSLPQATSTAGQVGQPGQAPAPAGNQAAALAQ